MRVTRQTDRYVILDDVLPPEQFELMVEYAARNDYARNPPFARAAIAGFFLTEADDTPFWR